MNGLLSPEGGRAAFLTMALACFLAVAVAIAARIADVAEQGRALDAIGAVTVRIIAPTGPNATERAAAALRQSPAVAYARPLSGARAQELAESWSGLGLDAAAVAELGLIEARAAPGRAADPGVAAEIERTLQAAGIDAQASLAGPTAQRQLAQAQAGRQLRFLGVLGVAGLAFLIVAAAAHARARMNGAPVAVMVELGATRGQAARGFAEDLAGSGFAAGVLGAVAAVALGAAIWPALSPGLPLTGVFAMVGPLDFAPLAIAPVAAALAGWIGGGGGARRAYQDAAAGRA